SATSIFPVRRASSRLRHAAHDQLHPWIKAEAEVPVISTEAQMLSYSALPLDAYSLEFDHLLVRRAQYKLIAECVKEKGFELGPYLPPGYESPPRRARLVARFGVGLAAEVQQYGYGLPPDYQGPPPPPPPPPMSQALDIA